MRPFNLSRRLVWLLAAFGTTSVLTLVAFGLLLRSSIDNSTAVANSATGDLTSNYHLLESLGRAHNTVQQLIRQKDPDALEALLQEVKVQQENVYALINKDTYAGAATLKQKFTALVAADQLVIDSVMHGNVASAYEQFFGAAAKCQEEVLGELKRDNEAVVKATADNLAVHRANIQKAMLLRSGGLSILLAGLLAFGWRLKNQTVFELSRISHDIGSSTNELFSAASQVSNSSQSLAQGSGEQAASIEETSASLEEMASMTQRNSENASKANELAKEARVAADKGVGDMQTMSAAMQAIKVSSDDIAKIIKTIDEIAFQTNILALNAAVEAARAGEAGMGFAVVADEVRNLAQRSATAAKETAAKIEGAITKTTQGVDISQKVAQVLNEIVAKIRQVDDLAAEVASASREQTRGITQINSAVGQMDKVTQSNAASAEQSAAAAEELTAQAELMKQSVTELISLGGTSHQAKPAPEPHKNSEPVKTVKKSSAPRSEIPLETTRF